MKKFVNLCLLFFIMLIFTGCSTKEFMNAVMESWVGYSLDDVIRQWGYPTDEKNIAGKRLVYWSNSRSVFIPQTSNSTVNLYGNNAYINSTSYGGGYQNYYCNRILEIDKNNKVAGWQWDGNNCPFGYSGKYKSWVNSKNNSYEKENSIRYYVPDEYKSEVIKLYNHDKLSHQEKILVAKYLFKKP